jgi:hypothetical protein
MVTGFPPNREDESQTDRQPIRQGGLLLRNILRNLDTRWGEGQPLPPVNGS